MRPTIVGRGILLIGGVLLWTALLIPALLLLGSAPLIVGVSLAGFGLVLWRFVVWATRWSEGPLAVKWSLAVILLMLLVPLGALWAFRRFLWTGVEL